MMNPSFDALKLSDEHVAIRAVLRYLCEREIAPHAAEWTSSPGIQTRL